MSSTESNSQIKEMYPKRRSAMISKMSKSVNLIEWPRETPLRYLDKITVDYQLDIHLASDEDHVKGNMPQYGIRCW